MRTSIVIGVAALAAASMLAHGVRAQGFPAKPVRFIVPAPPGSAPDFLARTVGQKMNELWNQPVLIDNVVGAAGNIGTERVAKSPPDGYTLLFNTIGPIAVNISMYSKLPFDPVKDFAPITVVAYTPNILCIHPSVPARNVRELVSLAKRNPGKMHYGSPGSGTSPHLSGELFNVLSGIKIVHVPYKSSAQMTVDTIGGQVDMIFHNAPVVQPHVQGGKLRGLAVTSATRLPSVPELPTMAEAGVKDFEVTSWFGILAPAGTPQSVIDRLYADTAKIIRMPDVNERFMTQAALPGGNRPEEFAAFIASEIRKWAVVIKASGAKVE
jgi:tripartite-type tricarboxylate transporter receptor subunit TctC